MGIPEEFTVNARSLPGTNVRFLIANARVPEPLEMLTELYGRELMHGKVTAFTDSGTNGEIFAVVEVPRLGRSVVVAAKHLERDEE